MTAEAILRRMGDIEALITHFGGRDRVGYETNARATAVADLFARKILGKPEGDAVPLEELVTPPQLPQMREIFADPDRRARVQELFASTGIVAPRVRPQEDGSLVVLFVHVHPEATEPALLAPQDAQVIEVRLRLVENPNDWRVVRVG